MRFQQRLVRQASFLLTAIAALATAQPAAAHSVLSNATSAAEIRYAQVAALSTLPVAEPASQAQLQNSLHHVIGRPSLSKYVKYQGDFASYWRASESSYLGKGFEALLAHQENVLRAAKGDGSRIVVTAQAGFKHHPADLVELAADGTILREFQNKLGARAAVRALSNPKYANMHILTTPESLQQIQREVRQDILRAAVRGRPPLASTQSIVAALQSGRLSDQISRGSQVPVPKLQRLIRGAVQSDWSPLARLLPWSTRGRLLVGRTVIQTARVMNTHPVAVRGLFIVDAGMSGYATYVDYGRWRSGGISGQRFAVKTSARLGQVGLAAYAIYSPEPTSKSLAGAVALGLWALDVGESMYDGMIASRERAAANVFGTLELSERALTVRQSLLAEIEKSRGAANPDKFP